MTAGTADGTLSVHHVKIHGNDAVGIANAKGRIKHSEFTNNTKDGNFAGFTGGGVKGSLSTRPPSTTPTTSRPTDCGRTTARRTTRR
jgi:hypothetical protein